MSDQLNLGPEDVLITQKLYRRQPRAASLESELSAYRELSEMMATSPTAAIQRFLELALELCPSAGSAGLSELVEEDGTAIFRWTAMAGAFAPYVGGTTPRDFSPCGLCLDHHHSVVVERPGRVFTYFNDAEPEIIEGLVVPLYDTGKRPIGTLWITSHDDRFRFDPTDIRIMEQLAVQLVLAIKLRRKAGILVQLEETARDKEILVQEVRHRVKNMIQMTSALLQLQERGAKSGETRSALREAQSRLLVLASVYESLLQPDADAREVDASSLVKRLVDALHSAAADAAQVRVETDCEPLDLGVSYAVPLGLIVNEAVTNAFKHAFANGAGGRLVVQLRNTTGLCSLIIQDDGPGFGTTLRDGSLGMRLIKNLARQLGGSLTVDGSNGTTVRVDWRVRETHARDALLPIN